MRSLGIVECLRASGNSMLTADGLVSHLFDGSFDVLFLGAYPKRPGTQITGLQGPEVFGPKSPIIWVLGPLGLVTL